MPVLHLVPTPANQEPAWFLRVTYADPTTHPLTRPELAAGRGLSGLITQLPRRRILTTVPTTDVTMLTDVLPRVFPDATRIELRSIHNDLVEHPGIFPTLTAVLGVPTIALRQRLDAERYLAAIQAREEPGLDAVWWSPVMLFSTDPWQTMLTTAMTCLARKARRAS